MNSLMRRVAVCGGALVMLCAFALAFSAGPARSDSNITLTPADIARADSLRAAKKAANALRKRQEQEIKQLQKQSAKEKANPNATPSNVTERLDSLAAQMLRSQGVPPPLKAKAPKAAKVKTPKLANPAAGASTEVKPAADVPTEAQPAPVAVPVKPAVMKVARKGPLPQTLTPLGKQTTDRAIARDLDAIDGWQAKLDSLPGAAEDVWRAAGARAWLDAARVEYTDNDRQGFAGAAFERGVALVSEIEKGAAPVDSVNAPKAVIPRGSLKVADSLYTHLESLKHNPGFRCAREPLAQLEVELAWTGNEQIDQGDCRTSPHLARANDLARTAQELVEKCIPPPVANLEAPPVPIPADTMRVVHVEVPTKEELKIPRNVHYALNEFTISPTSHRVIAGIAALLEKYPSITARLVGHTDSRGSADYNLELSKRRVNAARSEFIAMGIDPSRLSTDFKGKADIYAIEDSKKGFALNRRVEMVFVDSEGNDISGERQEGDLQLEDGHSARPKFAIRKNGTNPVRPPLKRITPGAVPKRVTGAKRAGASTTTKKPAPAKAAGR